MDLYKARVTLEVLVDGRHPSDAQQAIRYDMAYVKAHLAALSFTSEITDIVVDYPERIER